MFFEKCIYDFLTKPFSQRPCIIQSEDLMCDKNMYTVTSIGFFSQMTWAVLFAGVIKLHIAAPTQLLLRALLTPSATTAADAMLLRTRFIVSIQ